MKAIINKLHQILFHWPIQLFPVVVRRGIARGAKWTPFPYSSYWRDCYEPTIQEAILKYGCTPGMTSWDFGAHFGIYSIGMAMHVGPDGQVVSCEPDPFSFKRLSRHVRINNLTNIKLYQAAVSEKEGFGELLYYRDKEGAGTPTSHFAYPNEKTGLCSLKIVTPLLKMDVLVERGEVRPPQFIKIDIEGYGAVALRGTEKTLLQFKPTIVMSFHGGHEIEGVESIVGPLGYKWFSLKGDLVDSNKSAFKTYILKV